MILQNTVCFTIYVKDNPSLFYKRISTKKYIKKMWIPQTSGDQVWIWLEFKNENEKEVYINTLDENDKEKISKGFNQDILNYWT